MGGVEGERRRAKVTRRIEESKALREVLQVIRNRVETSETLRETVGRKDLETSQYANERRLLVSMNNVGLAEGVTAGVVTFLALRRGPHIISRWMNGGQMKKPRYQLDKTRSYQPFNPDKEPRSTPQFSSALLGVTKFILDVSASVLMAATTSFYFVDEQKLTAQAASIPLVEGRSVVSDEFCTALQKAVSTRNPEFWKTAQSPYLKNTFLFTQNCGKRQSFENKLREEQGLSRKDPVSIPNGGVPFDYHFEENRDEDPFADGFSQDTVFFDGEDHK